MNRKILKINSWILTTIGIIIMLLATICMLYSITTPSNPNSWDDLGKFFIVIVTVIAYNLCLPLVISGIGTLNYLKGKDTYKLCIAFDIIGAIVYVLFIALFICLDILNIFNDYYNGNVNIKLKIIYSLTAFFLFICPLIINIIGLYKDKNNLDFKKMLYRYRFVAIGIIVILFIIILYNLIKLNIIKNNRIEVNEDNTYSYSDFKSQLENRNLIRNKSQLTSEKEIIALDSNNKYGYTFSEGSYTDFYTLSVNTDRKFPLFIYNSYTSLIKKSDKTASYYDIGPEDWYINWYIYYINGKIYAAIGEESEYGSMWETSLSKTRYGLVVSEEKDITIYNSKYNYFVKGGGILDTSSGTQRSVLPTTTDIYNKNCMKIKVVNKVDAETLDKIAKELSPQYWKEYKKNN